MQTVVIVVHLMIVATLIATVLLQKSEGGGLGVGGGAGFMSSRGTANLLTRTNGGAGGGLLHHQSVPVLARKLRPQAEFDRCSCVTVAAGRRRDADCTADQRRRPSGFVEKSDEQQNQPAPSGPQAPRSQ